MDSWAISTARYADRLWLGIPDHLGQTAAGAPVDAFPTLEDRCGEDWSERLLKLLLPRERAWAWWTRNEVVRQSNLQAESAPSRVPLDQLSKPLRRSAWLRQMSLCVVPPTAAHAQLAVMHWAGLDVEQIPDQIWVAGAGTREWDLDGVAAFCSDRGHWSDPATAATQPAERIVLLFDRHVYCALEPESGDAVRRDLDSLAQRCGFRTVEGPTAGAWVTAPP